MPSVFIYVVDRDFGFAPNPFHGYCTLATCKPDIRKNAEIGDWVIGMGGSRLKATGQCVFAMEITAKINFDEYWINPTYNEKRPVRNGSRKMMVGDNIYHRDEVQEWRQADSHHSNPDGTVNLYNLNRDTKVDCVLLSNRFLYFGKAAPRVPEGILDKIGYKNPRSYRRFDYQRVRPLLNWLHFEMEDGLLHAAEGAGAEIRRGARASGIKPGPTPAVIFEQDGRTKELQARLIVCADGRGSVARKWAGFDPRHDPNGTLFAGVAIPSNFQSK